MYFSMFSVFRNSSIQSKDIQNPRRINRCVDRALRKPNIKSFDVEPPYLHLCSEQPAIPVQHVDVVRRPLAFGRWALPRLYRELHSTDPVVQLQAINSFCEIAHNPEKAFEAIRLKFVPRLGNLLLKIENPAFQERILLGLRILASQANGRDEIIRRGALLRCLKDLMGSSSNNVRCKTAALVEMISKCFTAAFVLINDGFIQTIVQYITVDDEEVTKSHLKTLERLFIHAVGQEDGILYDAISKLVFLLQSPDHEIVSLSANCLAMLVSHPDGKRISVERKLLVLLNELLLNKRREIYTSAAMVIMMATHKVKAKHQAASIPGLAERLLDICGDFKHAPAQMFAMKALGNMLEHPKVREKLLKEHSEKFYAICVCKDEEDLLKEYKEILLKLLNWKPWIG